MLETTRLEVPSVWWGIQSNRPDSLSFLFFTSYQGGRGDSRRQWWLRVSAMEEGISDFSVSTHPDLHLLNMQQQQKAFYGG